MIRKICAGYYGIINVKQSNDCPQEAYNTQQKIYYEHKYNAESIDEMREKKQTTQFLQQHYSQ